ncbi:hypothetical protein B0H10DRAFT_2116881 [Mycena sp. CBHHK59/15]|nr:hypothetical protein B0H10DRAFT_2116881 [Mycena sp. CBHHK59/15]
MESILTLRRLANIITDAVNTMDPFHPQDPAETLRQDTEVSAAVKNLMAAAAQISATVCDPMRTVVNTSHAFLLSSCLLAASELNVVEILREAEPKGVDAKEIAAASHTDPGLIARILRLLATHHIFREVSPGVFANNRISSTLDKGKPSSVLFSKYELSNLPCNVLTPESTSHLISAGLCGKSGVYLTDSLLNPSEKRLPYNLACATDEPLFTWMQRPENRYNLSRFAVAMQGTAATEPPELIFQGFDWSLLRRGGVLVDVGLPVVNQDLGPAIELSKAYWKEHFPAQIDSQMVEFHVHDFFMPQPVKNAALFLLRYILHDWPDAQVGTILKHLRDVALPTTTLVVIEKIQSFASSEEFESSRAQEIPGAARPTAAPPLLPNWGAATADLYLYDLNMHVLLGGVERTLEGFYDVLAAARWKLVEVHHCPGSQLSHLIAVPL